MKQFLTYSSLAFALLCPFLPLQAQEAASLDDLVKAAGCTPVIDGGTGGTGQGVQYNSSYGPAKAFDGITYSPDETTRWLGSIQNGTYLLYALPDDYPYIFQLQGYRLHALSIGNYNKDRAPRSWALYGNKDASAAASADTWELIDEQSGVVWSFSSTGEDASHYILEFSVPPTSSYRAFKFVPLTSNRPSNADDWTVGLMELVFLGEAIESGTVLIQGNRGTLGTTTPAYGPLNDLASGDSIEISAEELAYSDTTRYTCIGYTTEVMQDGTWVMEGTNLVRSATYTHDGQTRRITWLWEEHGYKLNAGLQYGGLEQVTVSPEPEEDGYYTAGAEVTLTPVAAVDPQSFFNGWYGDIPAGSETDATLSIVMDAPKSVYADFTRNWKFVDGSTTRITDGAWTLSIAARTDGDYAGTYAITWCAAEGGGLLDLSRAASCLNLAFSHVNTSVFSGKTNLCSLVLADSILSLANQSFQNCSSLTNVVLSSSLRTIGDQVFRGCTPLRTVTPFLPETLTTLGWAAFSGCTSLEGDLVLGENFSSMNAEVFSSTRITSVDMGASKITKIGSYAFSSCPNLTNAVLSPVLKTINEKAFSSCKALRTVTPFLPETLTTLGWGVFSGCSALEGDLVLGENFSSMSTEVFSSTRITSADMGASALTRIGDRNFQNCRNLTSVVLPLRLTTITQDAFYSCSSLTTVTPFLPRYITTLGWRAFAYCAITNALSLTSDSLTSLASEVFRGSPIPEITLPVQSISIGASCFSGIVPGCKVYFYGAAPSKIDGSAFNTGSTANPAVIYAPRKLDEVGWADRTTALTDSDLAKDSYPGPATFGVLVNGGYRHWLVNWNPPLASGPAFIILH